MMHPTVSCPHCQRHLELPDGLIGLQVQCGACGTIFLANWSEGPKSRYQESRYRTAIGKEFQELTPQIDQGHPEDENWDEDVRPPRRRVRRRSSRAADVVTGPATALMVVGILGVVLAGLGICARILLVVLGSTQLAAGKQQGSQMIATGVAGIVILIIYLPIWSVIAWGAFKMKKLESYGLAMTAGILAMIPCVSPIFIVGLPFGIWSLTVLNRPDVKQAFK